VQSTVIYAIVFYYWCYECDVCLDSPAERNWEIRERKSRTAQKYDTTRSEEHQKEEDEGIYSEFINFATTVKLVVERLSVSYHYNDNMSSYWPVANTTLGYRTYSLWFSNLYELY